MAVRSGEIDEWDPFDDLSTMVGGNCTGLSRYEAAEIIPVVAKLLKRPIKAEPSSIRICGAEVTLLYQFAI
jgi:hypothetical protein